MCLLHVVDRRGGAAALVDGGVDRVEVRARAGPEQRRLNGQLNFGLDGLARRDGDRGGGLLVRDGGAVGGDDHELHAGGAGLGAAVHHLGPRVNDPGGDLGAAPGEVGVGEEARLGDVQL